MRLVAIASLASLAAAPAFADGVVTTIRPFAPTGTTFERRLDVCSDAWLAMPAADQALATYRAYTSRCIVAGSVGAAETKLPPPGAIAVCRDGSYLSQRLHQESCERHGGVDLFL